MEGLVHSIEGNTKRYQQLFAEVVDSIMPKPIEASAPDVADILAHHVRRQPSTSHHAKQYDIVSLSLLKLVSSCPMQRQQRTQDAGSGVRAVQGDHLRTILSSPIKALPRGSR